MIFYWELSGPHSTPLYTVSGHLGKTATLSPHPLPNLPILHVCNLLCCSSRSLIKLFNSSSLPSDLLLRAFRSSLLPLSTLSWTNLARQSYSLNPPPTQSHNPQCPQLTMLFFKVSYKTIQFLFPDQSTFTESFQVLTPTPLYTVSGQLGKTATLSPHPLPKLQILNVLHFVCCSSRSVIQLFNSSSLPSDLLLRAFRSSLLPNSTLCRVSLARQSYSLTPPPTQSPNPQCSQLTMLFFKVSYKTIQFLFPAQWSFTESFQVLTLPLSTLSLASLARQLLSHPTPYPISQSSMFSTYYVVLQGQL